MIRVRQLPPDEWDRLNDTNLGEVRSHLETASDNVVVMAAEDEEGQLVGHLVFLQVIHVEGLWVHPDERRKGRVLRALWSAVEQLSEACQFTHAWACAQSDQMKDLVARLGSITIQSDITHHIWPIRRTRSTRKENHACHPQY